MSDETTPQQRLFFKRIGAVYPDATLWGDGDGIDFSDSTQGQGGTCYIISALSSLANYPDYIKSIFLEDEDLNNNGIYTLKFFIRGKPWLVTVDDIFLFQNENNPSLYYSKLSSDNSMWSALIEKAWAKLKGSYTQAWNGYNVNGLRTLTGAPVFTYKTH